MKKKPKLTLPQQDALFILYMEKDFRMTEVKEILTNIKADPAELKLARIYVATVNVGKIPFKNWKLNNLHRVEKMMTEKQ